MVNIKLKTRTITGKLYDSKSKIPQATVQSDNQLARQLKMCAYLYIQWQHYVKFAFSNVDIYNPGRKSERMSILLIHTLADRLIGDTLLERSGECRES